MNEFEFTIIFYVPSCSHEEMAENIFEAGCDDGTFASNGNNCTVAFFRKAKSLKNAVLSAIRDVTKAQKNVRIVGIEPSEFVTTSEIAGRVNVSREAVRLYSQGRRGPGGFPAPFFIIGPKMLVWRWSEVSKWFFDIGKIVDENVIKNADEIAKVHDSLVRKNLEW